MKNQGSVLVELPKGFTVTLHTGKVGVLVYYKNQICLLPQPVPFKVLEGIIDDMKKQ